MIDAAGTPQTIRLSDYRPPAWRVPQVALDFDLGAERTRVTARLTVERNGKRSEPLVLDGQGLTLISVKRDGVALDVQPVSGQLSRGIEGLRIGMLDGYFMEYAGPQARAAAYSAAVGLGAVEMVSWPGDLKVGMRTAASASRNW